MKKVNELDREGFVERFGGLYEHSPWVAEAAWEQRPFGSLAGMHAAFARAVQEASPGRRMALIKAHPDLAGKAAVAGALTGESAREQSSAGLDRLTPEEYEAFTRINRAYREKFGFPMIVAVRDHTKGSIISQAEARLENPRDEEIETALREIDRISQIRLYDQVEPEAEIQEDGSVEEKYKSRIVLGQNNYGKSGVRVFKVRRGSESHDIWDLNVRVVLEGDFKAAHVEGDNSRLLATDTMRNACYALAKDHLVGSIEEYGLALVDHFLEAGPTVTGCRVEITQYLWKRIEVDGQPHDHSFVRQRGERAAEVWGDESGVRKVGAGIGEVYVLKTTRSGWEGFLRERFTTLPDTDDRILATVVTAKWEYNTRRADFDRLWNGVLDQTLRTFTDHYSPSVQNTLYRTGRAVLERFPEVERIWYSLPNVHHVPYDLERFGIENGGEIFHATREPYGQIEGWVERRAGREA